MNKKIFAALASATMALSATGSLAVFAEDFDVITESVGSNNTIVGTVTPESGLVLNSENFPDAGFRTNLIGYLNALGLKDTFNNNGVLTEGSRLTKDQVEAVKTICVGDFATASMPTTNVPTLPYELDSSLADTVTVVTGAKWDTKGAKDLTGIEYFTNLEKLYVNKANSLVSMDLENNTNLADLNIQGCGRLATIELPATNTLANVTLIGSSPITEFDLSKNKGLNNVTIQNTLIAVLDLSNNPYLGKVIVDSNKLNTLNLANSLDITTLDCHGNNLYGLELPSPAKKLTSVDVHNNVLQELVLPKMSGVTKLDVSDNELSELDLSNVAFADGATDVYNFSNNHLGALNIKTYPTTATPVVSPQTVYIAPKYDAVNLEDSFADLKGENVVETAPQKFDKKTGVFSGIGDNGAKYQYNVDGTTTNQMDVYIIRADVLNRLYNPNSGEHFYTKDLEEKDVLVDLGWKDEGVAWTSPVHSTAPVFRLYNPNAGDHHYTMSGEEKDVLVTLGWKYEGVGWYSYNAASEVLDPTGTQLTAAPTTPVAGTLYLPSAVTVYREYNPNAKAAGAHNYTVNEAENDFLVSVGWIEEGTAWSAIK